MSTQLSVWNPIGFDPRDHMPARMWKRAGLARFVVHRLVACSLYRPKDGWVSLNRAKMVAICNGNNRAWDEIRKGLTDAGVIESASRYVPGRESRRYRLCPPWNRIPVERTKISDARLADHLRHVLDRDSGRPRFEAVHYHLESFLKRVTFDNAHAQSVLSGMTPDKRWRAERAMGFVVNDDPPMVLGTTGRLYTAVSCLPRAIRPALRIDGQSFVELDIANSQPLILGMLCMHSANPGLYQGRGERVFSSLYIRVECTSPPSVNPCIENDAKNWVDSCMQGTLYEDVADALEMPCSTAGERDKVKIATCRIMFGRHRPKYRTWQRFSERWPTLALFLADLKSTDYRNVARHLQRVESDLMINAACESLRADHPDIPILTIHDSLLVPLLAEDVARLSVRAAWHEFGVIPKIRSKVNMVKMG